MIAAVAPAGLGGYVILYPAVAAAWIGIPIVGAGALAAAGVLASESELNLWLVIVVATFAAWTGGYGGDWFGGRAGSAVTDHDGRWQRQRRQVMATGERVYRRWGRLAVFVTPDLGLRRAEQLPVSTRWPPIHTAAPSSGSALIELTVSASLPTGRCDPHDNPGRESAAAPGSELPKRDREAQTGVRRARTCVT